MSCPSSPAGGTSNPLQPVSHNQQRESALFSPVRERIAMAESPSHRDSSVHEKINQFNTLAMQSKHLERKTADAALKRAMLGREEAEAEMRRYRDEVKSLRKAVEEGKDRERRVGERLEAVMENYGRAKETHAHTQQLWEKEIRRARKETFKAQSALVKLQEELKSSRTAQKAAEEELQSQREQSQAQEQELFSVRYNLVGLQEQLDQAQERVKALEQEVESLKTIAQNAEEAQRIASEAKVTSSLDTDTEEPSEPRASRKRPLELDIETLTMQWEWEKQRADRAQEQIKFLEVECQLKMCSGVKSLRHASSSRRSSPRLMRGSLLKISDAGDDMILSESRRGSPEPARLSPRRSKTEQLKKKEPRRSTIFLPEEGIFRTVPEAEAEAAKASSTTTPTESLPPLTPADSDPMFRRTPSLDPPDFALLSKERTSLLSLLDAPHRQSGPAPVFNIPTTPGPEPQPQTDVKHESPPQPTNLPRHLTIPPPEPYSTAPLTDPLPTTTSTETASTLPYNRPHTSASAYTTTVTTTTKVPLREGPHDGDGPTLAQRLMKMQRTPSRNGSDLVVDVDKPSFDATNPALTPTMTREEALAQIRERRGRARSVGRVQSGGQSQAQGQGQGQGQRKVSGGGGERKVSGDRKVSGGGERKVSGGGERGRDRRDVSAPTGRVTPGTTGRVTPATSGRVTPAASGRITPGVGARRVRT